MKEQLTDGWRKPHNKELHNLCSSPIIVSVFKSRRMRWTELASRRRDTLVGKAEGKRYLIRLKCKW
jgi:hypothetical protein